MCSAEELTKSSGEYNSLPLPPGRYAVTVRQTGFREQTAEVTLGVGQRLQIDFALELGSVTEQVSVSAIGGGDRDGVLRDRPGAARRARSWTCR